MAARILGLKLRLLGNTFRRGPWQVAAILVGVLYGVALIVAITVGLGLLEQTDAGLRADAVVVGGGLLLLAFAVLPLLFPVQDTLDPRAFSLFGIGASRIAADTALTSLIGIPGIGMIVIGIVVVAGIDGPPGAVLVGAVGALLAVVSAVLLARIATSIADLVVVSRRARETSGIVGVVLLLAVSPLVALLLDAEWGSAGRRTLSTVADVLAFTPLGAGWAAPASLVRGDGGAAAVQTLIAAATAVALAALWRLLVGRLLTASDRPRGARSGATLGWFARLRQSAGGAVAARSVTYWARDPRYHVPLVVIPILPVVVVALFGAVHVPWNLLALAPVPIVCLFLGWALHNDLAYDGSALWLHVASGVRGRADRMGRAFPTLLVGVPVALIGSVASAVGFGEWDALPAIIGLNTCLLLTGVGVSAVTSARFPYPVPRPGDSPFVQPQAPTSSGGAVQALTFVTIAVLSAPTGYLAWRGLVDGGDWYLFTLGAGLATGLVVVVGGTLVGGRVFDRRGPELVGFSMRG